MATEAQREHGKSLIDLLHAHAALCGYPPGDHRTAEDSLDWSLSEQQMTVKLEAGHPIQMDCSETDSWIFRQCGLWPFAGSGYTGTWLDWLSLHYRNPKEALLLAPVIWTGPRWPDGHHMGLVYKPDPQHGNPVIASHGQPGFELITLAAETARQALFGAPTPVFCSILHL